MSNQQYALLWSKQQGCFHIEPLERTLQLNRAAFANNKTLNDYHVIDVGTQQAMYDAAEVRRKTLYARREAHV